MLHQNSSRPSRPPVLALFQKRIEGDDALLELARDRFRAAGLGTEFYAETKGELEWLLRFRPSRDTPAAVHLSRGINLFDEEARELVIDFARSYRDHVFGLIVHDQSEIATRFDDFTALLDEMELRLQGIGGTPTLFIEYAVGLELETFIALFRKVRGLRHVSSCIDVGHIGIHEFRSHFYRIHPGMDAASLRPDDPLLPAFIGDVESALEHARERVLYTVRELCKLGKPLHVHLHDGHPLSTFSPFGVPDHLSFLGNIALPFTYRGKETLPLMFGPAGLARILRESLLNPCPVSFCLEIHPLEGRAPLGEASHLFRHWSDKTNAERMNHWLTVLFENHRLLWENFNILACPGNVEKGDEQ